MTRLRDRPKLYSFGLRGPGVYLTDELLASMAYRTLPANHRLVLIRAIRAYEKASAGDREDLSNVGFIFTYSMCGGDCDPKSFYGKNGARANICKHGFFTLEPKLKGLIPGAPDRFLTSREWQDYLPTARELACLKRRERNKTRYLERGRKRRGRFLGEMKSIGKNHTDTIGKKHTH